MQECFNSIIVNVSFLIFAFDLLRKVSLDVLKNYWFYCCLYLRSIFQHLHNDKLPIVIGLVLNFHNPLTSFSYHDIKSYD